MIAPTGAPVNENHKPDERSDDPSSHCQFLRLHTAPLSGRLHPTRYLVGDGCTPTGRAVSGLRRSRSSSCEPTWRCRRRSTTSWQSWKGGARPSRSRTSGTERPRNPHRPVAAARTCARTHDTCTRKWAWLESSIQTLTLFPASTSAIPWRPWRIVCRSWSARSSSESQTLRQMVKTPSSMIR